MKFRVGDRRGSVLMFVLIVAGIMTLVIGIAFRVTRNRQKIRERNRHIEVVKNIHSSIMGRLTADSVIYSTRARGTQRITTLKDKANVPMLERCVRDEPVNWNGGDYTCIAGGPDNPAKSYLWVVDEARNYVRLTTNLDYWTSNITYRRGFDLNGKFVPNCDAPGATCPYAAEALVWAECSKVNPHDVNRPATCDVAEKVFVALRVVVRDRTVFRKGTPLVAAYPPDKIYAQYLNEFSRFITRKQLVRDEDAYNRDDNYSKNDKRNRNVDSAQTCPENGYVAGVNSKGRFICACQLGFVDYKLKEQGLHENPNVSVKKCEAVTSCDEGEILVGTNPDGTLNCKEAEGDLSFNCYTMQKERYGTVACAEGERMASAKMLEDECYVIGPGHADYPTGKPSPKGDDIVDCGPIEIKCCARVK